MGGLILDGGTAAVLALVPMVFTVARPSTCVVMAQRSDALACSLAADGAFAVAGACRGTGGGFIYHPRAEGMGGLILDGGTAAVLALVPMVGTVACPTACVIVGGGDGGHRLTHRFAANGAIVVAGARRGTSGGFIYHPCAKGMGGLILDGGTAAVLAFIPMVGTVACPSSSIIVRGGFHGHRFAHQFIAHSTDMVTSSCFLTSSRSVHDPLAKGVQSFIGCRGTPRIHTCTPMLFFIGCPYCFINVFFLVGVLIIATANGERECLCTFFAARTRIIVCENTVRSTLLQIRIIHVLNGVGMDVVFIFGRFRARRRATIGRTAVGRAAVGRAAVGRAVVAGANEEQEGEEEGCRQPKLLFHDFSPLNDPIYNGSGFLYKITVCFIIAQFSQKGNTSLAKFTNGGRGSAADAAQ